MERRDVRSTFEVANILFLLSKNRYIKETDSPKNTWGLEGGEPNDLRPHSNPAIEMKESELCFPSTLQARGSLRLLLALCALLLAGLAHAQSVLDKTDYGKSQNTNQDIANSLIPGPKRVGKGEKKEEVDPKKLPSKSIKDPAFEGSLNDIGLDWTGDKMGKPRTSNDPDSKAPKKSMQPARKIPKFRNNRTRVATRKKF